MPASVDYAADVGDDTECALEQLRGLQRPVEGQARDPDIGAPGAARQAVNDVERRDFASAERLDQHAVGGDCVARKDEFDAPHDHLLETRARRRTRFDIADAHRAGHRQAVIGVTPVSADRC